MPVFHSGSGSQPSHSFTLTALISSDWNCLQTHSGCLGSAHSVTPARRAQDTCCRYSDIKQSDGVSETDSAVIVMNDCENKELISVAHLTNRVLWCRWPWWTWTRPAVKNAKRSWTLSLGRTNASLSRATWPTEMLWEVTPKTECNFTVLWMILQPAHHQPSKHMLPYVLFKWGS